MAHLPPTKPRNAGLFQPSGKVHIFKKLKISGERRAAKHPCFKEFGGSLCLYREVVEISTENVKRITDADLAICACFTSHWTSPSLWTAW